MFDRLMRFLVRRIAGKDFKFRPGVDPFDQLLDYLDDRDRETKP